MSAWRLRRGCASSATSTCLATVVTRATGCCARSPSIQIKLKVMDAPSSHPTRIQRASIPRASPGTARRALFLKTLAFSPLHADIPLTVAAAHHARHARSPRERRSPRSKLPARTMLCLRLTQVPRVRASGTLRRARCRGLRLGAGLTRGAVWAAAARRGPCTRDGPASPSPSAAGCSLAQRLVPSRVVSSRVVPSRLVSSRPVSSRPVSSRPVSCRLVPCRPVTVHMKHSQRPSCGNRHRGAQRIRSLGDDRGWVPRACAGLRHARAPRALRAGAVARLRLHARWQLWRLGP